MKNLEIRAAVTADKDKVLEFCKDTWDWGDYIDLVWDDWLSDPDGRLIVAVHDGVPVAVVHLVLMPTGEGWIEGMRISLKHRDKGIGAKLSSYCLDLMSTAGIRVVRYLTASSNEPVHRISEKQGFTLCGSCYVLWAGLQEGDSNSLVQISADYIDELWSFIEKSDIYKAGAGLYSVGWVYQELSKDRLKQHLERGQVYALAEQQPLDAFAIVVTSWLHQGPVIGYLDGENVQLLSILISELRLLDMTAEVTSEQRIDANFPELDWMKKLYLDVGYQPYYDEPFCLYELLLD
jgi:GNAT superfamily N-acetyltransferase